MDELISKIKGITNLSELENHSDINPNMLLYAVVKSARYDLLKNSNIRLNINDYNSLELLTELLLSDEDILYYMHHNDFYFSKEELDSLFNIVFRIHKNSYTFNCFFRDFFGSNEELDTFIKEHYQFFENYIREKGESISYFISENDIIVEIILKGNNIKLIRGLENYSLSNLRLLAKKLESGINNLPYYLGNDRFAEHLFDFKSGLNINEFCELLSLLREKSSYERKNRDSESTNFTNLVNENIDFLIDMVSQTKIVPKCLVESVAFRDECIKRNRIDIAVECLLPLDIMKNENLMHAYCKELGIEPKEFYENSKWLLNYYEKNDNIFNTFIATSLKNNIFHLNKEHYERFINDIELQISLAKFNDKELIILSKILNIYNYKDNDITLMIVNVINNIRDYQELITSLNIEELSEQDLRKLVSVLQLPKNQFQINSLISLQNYDAIKKQHFVDYFSSSDLATNKDNLLKVLFNINLTEAQYIDSKYCHENNNNNILENLKNSELPSQIYNYLVLINKIIECDNINELSILYNSLKDTQIYDSEIPFEPFLRGKYTELYSQSLYKIDEKDQIHDPKTSISNQFNYNGKNISVSIPRENFNLFIHCVGSCSVSTDKNYKNDWLYRPKLQDHFVACSYINEKGIYSIRSQGSIIIGFDTLENGAILGMGNTDIDSIGRYANTYDGSRELQEENGSRARFFVPSEILKTINNGYNEIVIERRNTDQSRNKEFKRKPDYIIMMAESMEQKNFTCLDILYQNQLSFITKEDKEIISQIGNSRKLKEFLAKYKDIIKQNAEVASISLNDMANTYVDLIMKAKYFEDCLKASSEFDIPLIIVDKTYYFNKMLSESMMYDEATMSTISDFYSQSDETKKSQLYNAVAKGKDLKELMQNKKAPIVTIGVKI